MFSVVWAVMDGRVGVRHSSYACSPAMLVVLTCGWSMVVLLLAGAAWRIAGWRAARLHEVASQSVMRWQRHGAAAVVVGLGNWLIQISVD